MERTVYLDNAATTFPKPEQVYIDMDNFYRKCGVNAGRSSYSLAKEANNLIQETKNLICEMVNYKHEEKVIFTPSATYALNQIINGLEWDEYKTVYVTPFEHNAIMRPLHLMKCRYGINIKTIPFNQKTFELDEDKMRLMFSRDYPDYIFMSHVSNVTGYELPIKTIIQEAKKYNSIITLDCAQSMGLIPIDMQKLDIDYLVFAGHKTLYGPFGVAGYIYNTNMILKQFIVGGTGSDSLNLNMPKEFPMAYEPASPNIQAISGLKSSIKWINGIGLENIRNHKDDLIDKLINGLNNIYEIETYIPKNIDNHTSILSFNINGYNPNELGEVLDQDFNISVRTGYHCAPLIHDFLGTKDIGGTIRVSLSYFNTKEDIEYFLNSIEEIVW
ncbi:hypothetical protein Z969_10180 [Clostridium novyi A str. 4570]|uniref:Aminotransferase class V domain-containing protein n=1 Tax=Clostridium novyi A str. 4570 TaxID=1444290 RepID=A0AA88ZKI0_CLONO|nr:aminotransferase class V-fold PLP-dependent enzyme [Clostridium novyi]KGN00095.1 hypothetical protein Z969_10180 [Clostridium novyi A str. 4570]